MSDETRDARRLAMIERVIMAYGCSCDCGHDYGWHGEECVACLACRIAGVLSCSSGPRRRVKAAIASAD